jgi:hypothetical protein
VLLKLPCKAALFTKASLFLVHFRHVLESMSTLLGCHSVKVGSRCGEGSDWMGLEPAAGLAAPDSSSGPTAFGLGNPGCRDCSGCEALLHECKDDEFAASATLEYIAIEFARDVSIQSSAYATTQESVVLGYLARDPPDYIVFNCGLHDTSLPDPSSEAYERNLRWYMSVLLKLVPASRLLWVHTTAVHASAQPERFRNVTSNVRVWGYNQVAQRVMNEHGVRIVDPFPMLLLPVFEGETPDGVHFYGDQGFYNTMAWNVISSLCFFS